MEEDIVEELSRKYGRSEKAIELFIKICIDNNLNNIREQIANFYLD